MNDSSRPDPAVPPPTDIRPSIAVSRCLLGEPVRYDGGHRLSALVAGELAARAHLIPCCPEMELGMGAPREPISLVLVGGQVRLLGNRSHSDWTEPMEALVNRRAEELSSSGICGAVLKARSPSCGVNSTPLSRSDSGPKHLRHGLFAAALLARLPALPVIQEAELIDLQSLEAFWVRVLDYCRQRTVPGERSG
ncbi:MAG: DUF523 domain-containing protein [Bradymonadales bacterium]|nr:DUF523 domain-containing protein [Bradymonadales bacterium]